MRLELFANIAVLLARALAQTPSGTLPTTDGSLGVSYGSRQVSPGIMLTISETSTIPTFNFRPSSAEQIYTLLLVDLSISTGGVDPLKLDPAQLPLAPGVGNRTTRLHFWQAGLTFSNNGTLVNNTEPVARYNGPRPPPGDIPHDYVFYLFEQEEGFAPPPENNPFNVKNVNANPMNRMSFSVPRLASGDGVGNLVAANYIMVQNSTASVSSGSSGNTASATGSSLTPSSSPFTGAAGTLAGHGILQPCLSMAVVLFIWCA